MQEQFGSCILLQKLGRLVGSRQSSDKMMGIGALYKGVTGITIGEGTKLIIRCM
jgi:hypothetical protein